MLHLNCREYYLLRIFVGKLLNPPACGQLNASWCLHLVLLMLRRRCKTGSRAFHGHVLLHISYVDLSLAATTLCRCGSGEVGKCNPVDDKEKTQHILVMFQRIRISWPSLLSQCGSERAETGPGRDDHNGQMLGRVFSHTPMILIIRVSVHFWPEKCFVAKAPHSQL